MAWKWFGVKTLTRWETVGKPRSIDENFDEDTTLIEEIDELNGVLVYGETREEAIKKVKTLALRVIADRLENGESLPQQVESLIFEAARAIGNPRKPNRF